MSPALARFCRAAASAGALACSLALVAAACAGPSGAGPSGAGPSGTGPSGTGPSGADPSGAAPAPSAETPHPAWTAVRAARTIDGAAVAGLVVPGQPAVFIVFATWCGPCRTELATLGELRAELPGLAVVGLNHYEGWSGRSDQAKMRAFVAENAPWLPVVQSDDALLATLGGVPKIPSLFVFDRSGRLAQAFRRHEVAAPPTLAELRATLAPLLAEPAPLSASVRAAAAAR
jgi:thiol-disulfide isomerase/thioredoxin